MKRSPKLRRETLTALDPGRLAEVAGGETTTLPTVPPGHCWTERVPQTCIHVPNTETGC